MSYNSGGIPLLSEQNINGYIEIPADMVGRVDFALVVRSDSMIGAGINGWGLRNL